MDLHLPAVTRYLAETSNAAGQHQAEPGIPRDAGRAKEGVSCITSMLAEQLATTTTPSRLPKAVEAYIVGPAARGYQPIDAEAQYIVPFNKPPQPTPVAALSEPDPNGTHTARAVLPGSAPLAVGPPRHLSLQTGQVAATITTGPMTPPLSWSFLFGTPPQPGLIVPSTKQSPGSGAPAATAPGSGMSAAGAAGGRGGRPAKHGSGLADAGSLSSHFGGPPMTRGSVVGGLLSRHGANDSESSAGVAMSMLARRAGLSVASLPQTAEGKFCVAVMAVMERLAATQSMQTGRYRSLRLQAAEHREAIISSVVMPAPPKNGVFSSKAAANRMASVLQRSDASRDDMQAIVRQIPQFCGLSDDLRAAVAEQFHLFCYPPGSYLYEQDCICDEVFVLVSGTVMLHSEGRPPHRLQPGTVLGVELMLRRQIVPLTVTTDPHFEAQLAVLSWKSYEHTVRRWAAEKVCALLPNLQASQVTRLQAGLMRGISYTQRQPGEALYIGGQPSDHLALLVQGQVLIGAPLEANTLVTQAQVVSQLRVMIGPLANSMVLNEMPRAPAAPRGGLRGQLKGIAGRGSATPDRGTPTAVRLKGDAFEHPLSGQALQGGRAATMAGGNGGMAGGGVAGKERFRPTAVTPTKHTAGLSPAAVVGVDAGAKAAEHTGADAEGEDGAASVGAAASEGDAGGGASASTPRQPPVAPDSAAAALPSQQQWRQRLKGSASGSRNSRRSGNTLGATMTAADAGHGGLMSTTGGDAEVQNAEDDSGEAGAGASVATTVGAEQQATDGEAEAVESAAAAASRAARTSLKFADADADLDASGGGQAGAEEAAEGAATQPPEAPEQAPAGGSAVAEPLLTETALVDRALADFAAMVKGPNPSAAQGDNCTGVEPEPDATAVNAEADAPATGDSAVEDSPGALRDAHSDVPIPTDAAPDVNAEEAPTEEAPTDAGDDQAPHHSVGPDVIAAASTGDADSGAAVGDPAVDSIPDPLAPPVPAEMGSMDTGAEGGRGTGEGGLNGEGEAPRVATTESNATDGDGTARQMLGSSSGLPPLPQGPKGLRSKIDGGTPQKPSSRKSVRGLSPQISASSTPRSSFVARSEPFSRTTSRVGAKGPASGDDAAATPSKHNHRSSFSSSAATPESPAAASNPRTGSQSQLGRPLSQGTISGRLRRPSSPCSDAPSVDERRPESTDPVPVVHLTLSPSRMTTLDGSVATAVATIRGDQAAGAPQPSDAKQLGSEAAAATADGKTDLGAALPAVQTSSGTGQGTAAIRPLSGVLPYNAAVQAADRSAATASSDALQTPPPRPTAPKANDSNSVPAATPASTVVTPEPDNLIARIGGGAVGAARGRRTEKASPRPRGSSPPPRARAATGGGSGGGKAKDDAGQPAGAKTASPATAGGGGGGTSASQPLANALASVCKLHQHRVAAVYGGPVVFCEEALSEVEATARKAARPPAMHSAIALQRCEFILIPASLLRSLLLPDQLPLLAEAAVGAQRRLMQGSCHMEESEKVTWPEGADRIRHILSTTTPGHRQPWQVELLASAFSHLPAFARLTWQVRLRVFQNLEYRKLESGAQIDLVKLDVQEMKLQLPQRKATTDNVAVMGAMAGTPIAGNTVIASLAAAAAPFNVEAQTAAAAASVVGGQLLVEPQGDGTAPAMEAGELHTEPGAAPPPPPSEAGGLVTTGAGAARVTMPLRPSDGASSLPSTSVSRNPTNAGGSLWLNDHDDGADGAQPPHHTTLQIQVTSTSPGLGQAFDGGMLVRGVGSGSGGGDAKASPGSAVNLVSVMESGSTGAVGAFGEVKEGATAGLAAAARGDTSSLGGDGGAAPSLANESAFGERERDLDPVYAGSLGADTQRQAAGGATEVQGARETQQRAEEPAGQGSVPVDANRPEVAACEGADEAGAAAAAAAAVGSAAMDTATNGTGANGVAVRVPLGDDTGASAAAADVAVECSFVGAGDEGNVGAGGEVDGAAECAEPAGEPSVGFGLHAGEAADGDPLFVAEASVLDIVGTSSTSGGEAVQLVAAEAEAVATEAEAVATEAEAVAAEAEAVAAEAEAVAAEAEAVATEAEAVVTGAHSAWEEGGATVDGQEEAAVAAEGSEPRAGTQGTATPQNDPALGGLRGHELSTADSDKVGAGPSSGKASNSGEALAGSRAGSRPTSLPGEERGAAITATSSAQVSRSLSGGAAAVEPHTVEALFNPAVEEPLIPSLALRKRSLGTDFSKSGSAHSTDASPFAAADAAAALISEMGGSTTHSVNGGGGVGSGSSGSGAADSPEPGTATAAIAASSGPGTAVSSPLPSAYTDPRRVGTADTVLSDAPSLAAPSLATPLRDGLLPQSSAGQLQPPPQQQLQLFASLHTEGGGLQPLRFGSSMYEGWRREAVAEKLDDRAYWCLSGLIALEACAPSPETPQLSQEPSAGASAGPSKESSATAVFANPTINVATAALAVERSHTSVRSGTSTSNGPKHPAPQPLQLTRPGDAFSGGAFADAAVAAFVPSARTVSGDSLSAAGSCSIEATMSGSVGGEGHQQQQSQQLSSELQEQMLQMLPLGTSVLRARVVAEGGAEVLCMSKRTFELLSNGIGRKVPPGLLPMLARHVDWLVGVNMQALANDLAGRYRLEEHKQGTELLRAGEPAPVIFLVASGECVMRSPVVGLRDPSSVPDLLDLATLREGATCGELSLLAARPLWYTLVVASSTAKVISVDLPALRSWLLTSPQGQTVAAEVVAAVAELDIALYGRAVREIAVQVLNEKLDISLFTNPMKSILRRVMEDNGLELAATLERQHERELEQEEKDKEERKGKAEGSRKSAATGSGAASTAPSKRPRTIVLEGWNQVEAIAASLARPYDPQAQSWELIAQARYNAHRAAHTRFLDALLNSSQLETEEDVTGHASGDQRIAMPAHGLVAEALAAPTPIRQPKLYDVRVVPKDLRGSEVESSRLSWDSSYVPMHELTTMMGAQVHIKQAAALELLRQHLPQPNAAGPSSSAAGAAAGAYGQQSGSGSSTNGSGPSGGVVGASSALLPQRGPAAALAGGRRGDARFSPTNATSVAAVRIAATLPATSGAAAAGPRPDSSDPASGALSPLSRALGTRLRAVTADTDGSASALASPTLDPGLRAPWDANGRLMWTHQQQQRQEAGDGAASEGSFLSPGRPRWERSVCSSLAPLETLRGRTAGHLSHVPSNSSLALDPELRAQYDREMAEELQSPISRSESAATAYNGLVLPSTSDVDGATPPPRSPQQQGGRVQGGAGAGSAGLALASIPEELSASAWVNCHADEGTFGRPPGAQVGAGTAPNGAHGNSVVPLLSLSPGRALPPLPLAHDPLRTSRSTAPTIAWPPSPARKASAPTAAAPPPPQAGAAAAGATADGALNARRTRIQARSAELVAEEEEGDAAEAPDRAFWVRDRLHDPKGLADTVIADAAARAVATAAVATAATDAGRGTRLRAPDVSASSQGLSASANVLLAQGGRTGLPSGGRSLRLQPLRRAAPASAPATLSASKGSSAVVAATAPVAGAVTTMAPSAMDPGMLYVTLQLPEAPKLLPEFPSAAAAREAKEAAEAAEQAAREARLAAAISHHSTRPLVIRPDMKYVPQYLRQRQRPPVIPPPARPLPEGTIESWAVPSYNSELGFQDGFYDENSQVIYFD